MEKLFNIEYALLALCAGAIAAMAIYSLNETMSNDFANLDQALNGGRDIVAPEDER